MADFCSENPQPSASTSYSNSTASLFSRDDFGAWLENKWHRDKSQSDLRYYFFCRAQTWRM